MHKSLKSLVGQTLAASRLYHRYFRRTAVISAFHRVDNESRHDPITLSVAAFEEFCANVGRHFQVISLTELLERIRAGADISRNMVITFDDGYQDNEETAAPILERYGLPATFFIATNMIGTETLSEWDQRHKVQSRWMNWDQVRELHQRGFEIGAHTLTHADLSSIPLEQARAEITESKRALERELGTEIRLFSYPFGGAEHVTDDVRSLVEQLGFDCCLSCHGGLVRPGDDPFRLQRVPVTNYYRDYWHLLAALTQGSRTERTVA